MLQGLCRPNRKVLMQETQWQKQTGFIQQKKSKYAKNLTENHTFCEYLEILQPEKKRHSLNFLESLEINKLEYRSQMSSIITSRNRSKT